MAVEFYILYFKHCLHVQAVQRLNDFDFDESIWLQLRGNDGLLVGNTHVSTEARPLQKRTMLSLLIFCMQLLT